MSPTQLHGVQRLRPDPVGARRDHGRLQRSGCSGAPAARRPDDREHLPRAHHELERPRDRRAESRARPCPNLKITPVFRSDGSGTSYNFSDYLSSVSPEWKSKIGVSTQPAFPAGVGAKGSGGVAGVVKNTPGGVTYVDVAYALDEPHPVRGGQERGREVPLSQHPADRRRGAGLPDRRAEQRDAHRQPAEVGAARVPDLHLHLHHRPAADARMPPSSGR